MASTATPNEPDGMRNILAVWFRRRARSARTDPLNRLSSCAAIARIVTQLGC